MIRFFKSPQPAALFVIPFIIIALWVYRGWNSIPVMDEYSLPVWKFIGGAFSRLPGWLNFIFLTAMISAEAIYFNHIINKREVLYKNSYLPALIFALLISCSPGLMKFHPVHFINGFILVILDRIFYVYKNDKSTSLLFDSAFFTGLAALIYFPALLLFPVVLIGLLILRPLNFREWLIVLIGFCLPFFFISVYMFWNRSLIPFWMSYIDLFPDSRPEISISSNPPFIWLTITLATLLLLSLIKLRANFTKNIIRSRSYQQIFFILLLLGSISIGITRHIQVIHFVLIALPASLFISYFYLSAKKRLRLYDLSIWLLIGLIVWNQVS